MSQISALTDLEEKRTSDQEQEQIDDLIRQMSGMYIDKDKKEQTMPTKNAVEMRRALLKEFFRDHLVGFVFTFFLHRITIRK